ncbi:hypothetical protein PG984_013030 [Apiospora sp. TS-2023a]
MAFQDPPAHFASAVTADYDMSGASSRAQARQKSRGKGPKAKDAPFKLSKVCFLVSKSIAVSSYRIQGVQALACGDNMHLVAVLELQTNSGVLSIINFHNPNKQLHIPDLGYVLPENGFYVLLGDSNVHHSLWGGAGVKACSGGNRLAGLARTWNMTCLNKPGTITYARAEGPGGVQSSIDVCFTGPAIQYCDTHWSEQLIDGIDSDHFAFATHLSAVMFELNEETVLDYRNVQRSKLRQMSRNGLLELGTPPLLSTARIESYAMELLCVLRSAQDASVPRKRRFNRRAQLQDSAKAKRQRKAFHEARAESKKRCQSKRRMRLWWKRRRSRVRKLLKTRRIDGIVSFRDRIRRESDENSRIFQLARAGRDWCLPRRLAHIKTLHDNKGTHETPSAKIHAVLRYNFPGYTSKEFWINVGVPQGSPLSPILFLIFAAPLLEELKLEGALSTAGEMANFAFHDDGYFLVSSRNFKTNCRIIEQLHERLLRWADDNGASSSPAKYGVMHFTDPNPRRMHEPCRLLPKIPGLPPDALKLNQHILGIVVDHQLRWNDQINDIEDKVTRRVAYLKRISGKTWGPTLGHMIQLYKSMVRPLFSNGCAAWFSYAIDGFDIKWRLGKGQINRLVKIEGPLPSADFGGIRRDLFRCCSEAALHGRLRSPEQKKLRENRIRTTRLASASVLANAIDKHLYQVLDAIAMDYRADVEDEFGWEPDQEESDLDWRWPKRKKHFMKTWFVEETKLRMDASFDLYRRQRSNNGKHYPSFKKHPVIPSPVALEQPWSDHCIDYCKGMSRAESTLYLQMVSGKIGLRGYLSTWRDVERTGPHTVDHLFIHCPLLAAEREELRHELGHLDLVRMLTENALASTRWALQHFGLEQFQWERENQLVRMALQSGSELKKP